MSRYACPECGYVYDEAHGEPHEGFPPGTLWAEIPEQWCCRDCAVREKQDFTLIEDQDQASASG